jgi:hypothetical protein
MTWTELQDEPTEDLIEYVKCRGHVGYEELANASFIAFTFRFRKEIIDKCRRIGAHNGYDRETCDMISDRTFDRFLKYPFGFKRSNCGSLKIETCVKVYLFKIAQRAFFDYAREQEHQSPYSGEEEVIVEFPTVDDLDYGDEEIATLRALQAKIEKALSTLTPNHRIIYLTYKAHEREGFKLPRKLLEKLRNRTGLEQSSIRVYKKEAFDTAQRHLDQK